MLELKSDLFSQILTFLIHQISGSRRAIASFRENYKENIKIFIISDSRGATTPPCPPLRTPLASLISKFHLEISGTNSLLFV